MRLRPPRAQQWIGLLGLLGALTAGWSANVSIEARLNEAKKLAAQRQFQQAQTILEEVLAQPEGESPQALHQLAVCYARQGKMGPAENTLNRLVGRYPDFPPGQYLKAYVEFATGKYAAALESATRYAQLAPNSGDAKKISGLSRYMLGDPAGAERDLLTATQRLPRDFESIYYLGRLYFTRTDLTAALQAFQRALELDPHSVKAYNHLGQTYEGLAQFDLAKEAYRKSMALEQQQAAGSEWPYLNLGALLLTEGDTAEAIRLLTEALARNPSSLQVKVKLGTALAAAQRYEEASAQLEAAVKADPKDPDAHYQLGRLLLKQGKTAEARTHLELFERLKQK